MPSDRAPGDPVTAEEAATARQAARDAGQALALPPLPPTPWDTSGRRCQAASPTGAQCHGWLTNGRHVPAEHWTGRDRWPLDTLTFGGES